MKPATAVVYVLSTKKVLHEEETDHFNLCIPITRTLKKSWDDIPWLLVANEVARWEQAENPLVSQFPVALQENMIRLNATNQEDIRKLWKEMAARLVS